MRPLVRLVRRVRPPATVRVRLTLLYGALFIASGAVLLAITYLLVRNSTNDRFYAAGGIFSGDGPIPPRMLELARQFQTQTSRRHEADLQNLLVQSGIALAITAVISIALGWLVAARVLRPLRLMNTAIRRISADNLHQRLDTCGPRDELKDLADTVDGLLGRLETALDAQKQFVANAAHELRTPLTLEHALLEETLTDRHATLSSFRSTFERLLILSDQQSRLLDALLTLAASERDLEHRETIDLAAVTDQALLAAQPEIDRMGLYVETAITPATTSGHRALVERLVTNLIDNATRYNTTRGRIAIATTATAEHANLRIANTGPVVPPEQVHRLFEPFRRLSDRTARDDGHHGLGLSIVRAIATAHDAALTARAHPEGGLTVDVNFPVRVNGAWPEHDGSGSPPPPRSMPTSPGRPANGPPTRTELR